jgi:hypothetical protein
MKFTSIFLIVLSCLLYFNSFSQTVEMDWGQFKKLPDNSFFQRIIGTDADGFFTIRTAYDQTSNENKFYLEYISSTTNAMETSNEIIFPSINGLLSEFEQIYYLNGKVILFSSIINQTTQTKSLYVQYLNNDGTLKNRPKEIGSIPLGNKKTDGFKIVLSENKSRILVYFYNSFVEYNNELFNIRILDPNLTEVYSGELTFPLMGRRFEIKQAEPGKDDNIFFMTKVLAIDAKKGKSSNTNRTPVSKSTGSNTNTNTSTVSASEVSTGDYDYTIYIYNKKRNDLTPMNVVVEKYVIKNAIFGLYPNEDILIEGFIANKNSKIPNEFIGAFYKKITIKTMKFEEIDIKKSIILFSKDFAMKFTQERNGTAEHFYDFSINKLGLFDNGTVVMFAEQQYVTKRTMIDPGTKEETYIYYYSFNDIIGVGINREGKLDWTIRIPKIQRGTDDYGYYSSYSMIIDANKAKILFNDNPANEKEKDPAKLKEFSTNLKTLPKAMTFICTVYSDGNLEKDVMFAKDDNKTFICPKIYAKTKQRYIIYGQKNDEYKFGTFAFD